MSPVQWNWSTSQATTHEADEEEGAAANGTDQQLANELEDRTVAAIDASQSNDVKVEGPQDSKTRKGKS